MISIKDIEEFIEEYAPTIQELEGDEPKQVLSETWEVVAQRGRDVKGFGDLSQWAIGDLANIVEKRFGKEAVGLFATEIGEKVGTVKQYHRVSKTFSDRLGRYPSLSWSHYRVAAGTKDPEGWITKAIDENLTVAAMMDAVRGEVDSIAEATGTPCRNCDTPIVNGIHVRYSGEVMCFCSWDCLATYATDRAESEKKAKSIIDNINEVANEPTR